MRKGIWEEFDGYSDIVKEIKAGRLAAKKTSFYLDTADSYIPRLHPDRIFLRVVDIIPETVSSKTFRLVSEDGYLPPFQAGQYISLSLEVDGIRTSRAYSISSQPKQIGFWDITVRRVADGLVSNYLLDEVDMGARLTASGPQGNFYFNPLIHDRTVVFIAGGSGITPFMSMIREIVECGLDRDVFLIYGNKNTDDIIFHQTLKNITDRFAGIHYVPVIENPDAAYSGQCGLITSDLLKDVIDDIENKTFFLCGPQGLYDFCLPELEVLGVPRRKIKKEMYGPPTDVYKDPGWPPEIDGENAFTVKVKGGKIIPAAAKNPLLVSLEKGGVVPPSICRSGECSMCRVKILSGRVFQPAGTPVRKSDRQYGYVHSCVAYPLEDLEILI